MLFLKEICVLTICFGVSFAPTVPSAGDPALSEIINIEKHDPSTPNTASSLTVTTNESTLNTVNGRNRTELNSSNQNRMSTITYSKTHSGKNSTSDTKYIQTYSKDSEHETNESTDGTDTHGRIHTTADGTSLGKRHVITRDVLDGTLVTNISESQRKTTHQNSESIEIFSDSREENIARDSRMDTFSVTDETRNTFSSHLDNPSGTVDTTQTSSNRNENETTKTTNNTLLHSINPTRELDISKVQTAVFTHNVREQRGKTIIEHNSPAFITLITNINDGETVNDHKNTNTSSIINVKGKDGTTSTTQASTQTAIESKIKKHTNEFNFSTKPTKDSPLASLGVGISTSILDGHDVHKSVHTSTVKETTTPDHAEIKTVSDTTTDVKYKFNTSPKNDTDTFVIKASLRPDMQELELKKETTEGKDKIQKENTKKENREKKDKRKKENTEKKDKVQKEHTEKKENRKTDKPLKDESTTDGPMLLLIPGIQDKENPLETLKSTIKQKKYIELLKHISESKFSSQVIVAGVNNIGASDFDRFLLENSKLPIYVVSIQLSNKTEEIYKLSAEESATTVTTLE